MRHPCPIDPQVAAVFDAMDGKVRDTALALRQIVLDTAAAARGVGEITETLKWGQPSYRPRRNGIGTAVRIGRDRSAPGTVALLFHCQTSLVATLRERYGDELHLAGNRAVVIPTDGPLPEQAIRHCIALALTYHRDKAGASK